MDRYGDIVNTIYKWSHGYDSANMLLMEECLTEDTELTIRVGDGSITGPFVGKGSVMQLFRDSLASQSDQRRHVTTNSYVFKEEGPSAYCKSVLTLISITDGVLTVLSSGIYEDKLVCEVDGQWRIARRHIALSLPY